MKEALDNFARAHPSDFINAIFFVLACLMLPVVIIPIEMLLKEIRAWKDRKKT